MKKYLILLLIIVIFPLTAVAQQDADDGAGETETAVFVPESEGVCDTDTIPLVEPFILPEISQATEATTTRVSVRSDGGQSSGGDNYAPDISNDGRYVVFESIATNLLTAGNDTNDKRDVFWHDNTNGQTHRISIRTGGEQANGDSCAPAVSNDGRYVAFASNASNLVDGDSNNFFDIFLHDRQTGSTILVSRGKSGQSANSISHDPDISADGRYVVFWSYASNLDLVNNGTDTNGWTDVFRYDRVNNTLELMSVDSNEVQGNGHSSHATISDDGTRIAFESEASNLVTGDGLGYKDIFVRNTNTGQTRRISYSSSGGDPSGDSWAADISADGLYVVFVSLGANLVSNDTNNQADVFLRDRNTDVTHRVSIATDGTQGDNWSEEPNVSADGRYVTFQSYATNLVAGDLAGTRDVFIRDRQANTLIRASNNTDGQIGNASSREPVITGDGRYVVFSSKADNLVANDTNGDRDIFIRDTYTAPPPPPPPSLTINYPSGRPGSRFIVTGAHFTANNTAAVYVNNISLGTIATDSNGGFTFGLATTASPNPTDEGAYVVKVILGSTAETVSFVLYASAPDHQEATSITFNVPDGIALDQAGYLPITLRN